ncbi:NAD-dependent epimerase/dehydratase family protein [Sanguibacter sp. HDW7]|uniref:NAD-dependent epimerase/dehydratase family protein n=1 Tax=Sanguibacter sp. HDW7 TaxID=2714931 RepID=UPI001407E151|nr:NAD-dependent epimerase/dehydratase family protein [Sanguibacter sp. HDW7]QIK82818.1 NAD-dependent epimerase/dehydratase family protein [Sanguibacter sp. HDW7]
MTTTLHAVLGHGPVGATLSRRLLEAGHDVRVVTRSGASTDGAPDVEQVRADASDPTALLAAIRGAGVVHVCANPPYHRWPQTWPTLTASILDASARAGADVVLAGNLYAYGRPTGPMTEDHPLVATEAKGRTRADVWRAALARHEAGDLRVTEIRGSDYVGPLARATAHAGERLVAPLLAGRTLRPIGSADAPHSWTYLPDLADAMIAAATTDAAWGHAWHAPSPEPLTFRELAARFATAADVPLPTISALPSTAVRAVGLVVPMMRELGRVAHQHDAPWILDSTRSEAVLGLAPTPWETIADATIAWWRDDVRAR